MKNPSQTTAKLHAVGRLEHLWKLAYGLGTATVISTMVLLAFVLTEWAFNGSIGLRTAMYYAWVGVSVVGGLWLVGPSVLRLLGVLPSDSVEVLALRVGAAYPDIRDTLSNALQLVDEARRNGSSELAQAAFEQAVQLTEPKDLTVIIDKRRPRVAMAMAAALLALVIGLPALFPNSVGAAYERLMRYNESFMPPAPFQLSVTPKSVTVMRGTTQSIVVKYRGTLPSETTLWIKEQNADRYTSFPVVFDTSRTYTHQLPGLVTSVEYYAEAPWNEVGERSDTGRIIVIDRPLVRTLNGRVIPPSYTGAGATSIDERQADVTALSGSVVDVNIVSNKQLKSAKIVIERGRDSASADTVVVAMKVNGPQASGKFSVTANGSYSIHIEDTDGQVNAEPVRYGIVALRDGYPTIAMMEPTKDVDVDASARLPILVAIADDYGFSSLRLRYRLLKSRYAQADEKWSSIDLVLDRGQTTLDVGYTWDLSKVGITPDDVYEFYVEVADNDIVTGPKTAKTSTYKVRMPSLEEVFAETDRAQSEIQKELKQLLKESEQVRKEADELRREMQKQQAQARPQTEWSDRKKAEDLAKRQQEIEEKMEKVAEKLEQMTEKLQQNQAISEETLKKYQELQKLMQQVKSPELERMQEQMKKAMEQISPEEMEKMMKQFKFDEEQFKKNIERTMNLLKRIQAEQKTDELAKRAEELARKQDELRERAQNTNPNDKQAREQLSKEQQQLQKDLDRLSEEAKELEDLMKDIGQDMPLEKMQNAQKDLDAQKSSQDMKDAQKNMEQGDMDEASKSQQQASDNLQRFAQQMQQMKKQMKKNAQKEAAKQMQKGLDDLVDLSRQQEQLMQQMQGMDPTSQQYANAAKQQQQMQQSMQNIANNMMQLSQKSTQVSPELAQDLGDALQQMQNAMQQMQERNGPGAQREQSGAMKSMNQGAQKMSDALGQMMQGDGQGQGGMGQNPGQGQGSGQSPFQRLQQLADQQQGINQGMQQMGQGGGQGQMTQEQRAQMGRLASQQGKALQALQELEKEQQRASGGKKPIGDLEQIAKDMQEVMTDMQTGSITPETRMRQERILSRLLNASRSMNERDYEKTRESRSGTDVIRKSPSGLDLGDRDAQSMQELMNELRKGYTKDYENLIRLYFEALQKRRLETEAQR